MKNAFVVASLLLSVSVCIPAEGEIAYFNGPSFAVPFDWTQEKTLDIDSDGSADLLFASGPTLTTALLSSALEMPFYAGATTNNSILCNGYQAVVLSAGQLIGAGGLTNGVWAQNNSAFLAEYVVNTGGGVFFGPNGPETNAPSQGWGGPLAAGGDGYLGLHFNNASGNHFGWVHVSLQAAPTIIDWAYETQVETAIVAGAVPLAGLKSPQTVRPGTLRLQWQSQAGIAYQVQFKSDLNSPSWTNIGFAVIAAGAATAVDVPLSNDTGFYRVAQTK